MADIDVTASLTSESLLSSDFDLSLAASSNLPGESSVSGAAYLLASLALAASGNSSVGSDFGLSLPIAASLGSGSLASGDLTPVVRVESILSGVATVTPSARLFMGLTLPSDPVGNSDILAEISWFAFPGSPPRMPTVNSAATLQQFIDATGVSRTTQRVVPNHSAVVDPNPPRKPYTPR